MPASGSPVALQHIEKRRAMGDAFRAGRLPAPAPLPEGDIDTQAARLAQAVSAGDEHSTAALVAALSAAGYGIRRADGKIGGAARGGQGMAFDEWQVAAMAKLYGQNYGVPLDRLAGAFVRNVPEFKAAPLASMLVEGIRAGAQAENNLPLRFWAQFIVELGRYSDHPYDLLNPVPPVTVRLDAVQTQLILMRLAGDLAVLEQRGARHSADAGAHFLLASFAEPRRAGSFLVAPEPQAGPPCGSTTDAENLIFDTSATATTTAFGQVTEFLSKNGFGGLGSYANGATRAGLVLTVLKFISTYAALDVKISMDGKLLTRTKNTNAGERRKLTATVRSNTGNWQMINCLRPALNLAGLDFSLPGDGPVANVKVTWNLTEGGGPEGLAAALDTATHLGDLLSGKDHDTGAIVYLDTPDGRPAQGYITFTNTDGQSNISAVGAAQKEDLALKGAVSVFKHATVTVSVQAKPTKLKDATAAASTLGDATANVIMFLNEDLSASHPEDDVLELAKTRLTTKGYGATKPVDANTTLEGKANNRRVEFTKIGVTP